MNEIYTSFSNNFMKQGLWSIHVAFFVILVCVIWQVPYGLWISSPFLLISVISVIRHNHYQKKMEQPVFQEEREGQKRKYNQKNLIDLIALKEGNEVFLVGSQGEKRYLIRNRGKSIYTLYNDVNFPICSMSRGDHSNFLLTAQNNKGDQVDLTFDTSNSSFAYLSGKLIGLKETFEIIRKHHHGFEFKSDKGKEIMTVQKGWMPVQWQKIFPPNAPTISILEEVSKENKEALLLIIGYILLQK